MTRQEIKDWQQAAISDGWIPSPTYLNESIDTAMTLKKDGFLAQVYLRKNPQDFSLTVWGPDRLVVSPNLPYSMTQLKENTEICSHCQEKGRTERLGFAGRVCPKCRKELAPKVEFSGWCD